MHHITLIEDDKLGVLRHVFERVQHLVLKKDRAREMREIVATLKGLKLIPKKGDVQGVALGVNLDGTAVMVIYRQIDETIVGAQLPEQQEINFGQPARAERLRDFNELSVGQTFRRLSDRMPFTKETEHTARNPANYVEVFDSNPKVILIQGE